MTGAHPPRHAAVYESGVDRWIIVMLALAPIVATGMGLYLVIQGHPGDASALFLTAAISLLVTTAFTVPCRYTILDDTLSVRCGLIFYQIPLASIVRVEASRSLRSGPALSLSRVLVATDKRDHLLSPKNREVFIAELNDALRQAEKMRRSWVQE